MKTRDYYNKTQFFIFFQEYFLSLDLKNSLLHTKPWCIEKIRANLLWNFECSLACAALLWHPDIFISVESVQFATIREETKIHQRWVQFALTPHFLHFSHSAHHFTSYSSPHITSILSLHFSSILFSLLNHLLSFYSLHSSLITIFSLHYISSHHYPHCFLQCVVFWSKTSSLAKLLEV